MKLLLLLLLILAPVNKLLMQEIPDCWCFPDIKKVWNVKSIPDSLWAMDTCFIEYSESCDSMIYSSYKLEGRVDNLYAKTGWRIVFGNNEVIPLSSSTMTMFTWEDISDDYPEIKEGFEALEDTFGTYSFIKFYSEDYDSTTIHHYDIVFDNYEHILSVNFALGDIDSVGSWYNWIVFPSTINEENSKIYSVEIYPNPIIDILYISLFCKSTSEVKISISNILGKLIYTKNILCNYGNNFSIINCHELYNGYYFINFSLDDRVIYSSFFSKY